MSIHIKIIQDDDPIDPREYDNLGVMACWHKRYTLGDVQPKCTPEEWLADNAPEGSIVLPLYLYDHSGITMSTGAFDCPWDSGQVGVIVATPEKIRQEWGVEQITDKIRAGVEACLRGEVETYNHYLTGNCWGYVIEQDVDACATCGHAPEREHVDSCWGFLGDDALDAMKDHVDAEFHEALTEAWANRGP